MNFRQGLATCFEENIQQNLVNIQLRDGTHMMVMMMDHKVGKVYEL